MSRKNLLVLGAGRSKNGRDASATRELGRNETVLGWMISQFDGIDGQLHFVGGYEVDSVLHSFPELVYHFNAEWFKTGPLASLRLALPKLPPDGDLYICYSDIVFRSDLIQQLRASEHDRITACISSSHVSAAGETQFETIKLEDQWHQFVGAIRVPENLRSWFARLVAEESEDDGLSARVSTLLQSVDSSSAKVEWVRVEDTSWAHVEEPETVSRFFISTKAQTLHALQGRLKKSAVLPSAFFSRKVWDEDRGGVLSRAIEKYKSTKELIVRSSASSEDGFEESLAGVNLSIGPVLNAEESLLSSIDQVFASYGQSTDEDEVLIQPFLSSVKACGVAFSRTAQEGAPYYQIEMDKSGSTSTVTGGAKAAGKVKWFRRGADWGDAGCDDVDRLVLDMMLELENVFAYEAIDVEFAIDQNSKIWVLQVRPMVLRQKKPWSESEASCQEYCDFLQREAFQYHQRDLPAKYGLPRMWSVMTDWNPAEMIGRRPNPLAFDLYRYLISDGIWAKQREEAGYKRLGAYPLIKLLGGQAYVDVGAALCSFVPADLDDTLSEVLLKISATRLLESPELHDRVEFDVIPTCLDLDFGRWNRTGIFSKDDFSTVASAYRAVTEGIINDCPTHSDAVHTLNDNIESNAELNMPLQDLMRICRDEGALPFAHLARAGFVAMSILKTALSKDLISLDWMNRVVASAGTVSKTLARDAWSVRAGKLSFAEFKHSYGHLRPNSYDILSETYADNSGKYLKPLIANARRPVDSRSVELQTSDEAERIDLAFQEAGLSIGAPRLMDFILEAISSREYGKFVFSKLLSKGVSKIAGELKRMQVDRELWPFASLEFFFSDDVKGLTDGQRKRHIEALCRSARETYDENRSVALPAFLASPEDADCFAETEETPNFVGSNSVLARVVLIGSSSSDVAAQQKDVSQLSGRIAVIESADPGYDYLFSCGISGLITAYGGPNSHMAIRCAEFGVPGAIGVGESTFSRITNGDLCELDAKQMILRITSAADVS